MVDFKVEINEEQLIKILDQKLDEIADDIFANSQQNIVEQGIIDEGTLLKSGNINREILSKEIIYTVPYADIIEFGRLPGSMPPVDAIKRWIIRKGLARDQKEVNKIAWAIAQDIKKYGQEPRPFLGPAIEKVKAQRKI